MRKSILFSLLCLIAIVSVACGGGNNATSNGGNAASNSGGGGGGDGGPAADDPMAFYKKEGNFTLSKTTSKMKMMDEWKDQDATFARVEVVKVDGNKIKVKYTNYDKDMKETSSNEVDMDLTPKDAPADSKPVEPPKTTDEKVTVKAGDFDAKKSETDMAGTKTTTWTAKGITVKSVMKSDMMESTTELQEYKLE